MSSMKQESSLIYNFSSIDNVLNFWEKKKESEESSSKLLYKIGEKFNIELFIPNSSFVVDSELLMKIPEHFATSNLILPLSKTFDKKIAVVVATPFMGTVLNELSNYLKAPLKLLLGQGDWLKETINKAYSEGKGGSLSAMDDGDFDELENIEDLKDMAQAAPVIKLVNTTFKEAILQKASDIHIAVYDETLEIRYRIDGILHVANTISRKYQPAIISRIKIMSNLDIAERRVPQDGRIKLKMEGKEFDIRVAITPTIFGEGAVMRILDKTSVQIGINEIGFEKPMEKNWLKAIAKPNGIILITGPTGSGKTTTLYGSLNHIKSPELKLITIEDPVEYQLYQIDQIQVNTKVGLTFASALRSILRQDPDIIMVGEIRDKETAEIAVQSALTGHLVLSTLHTNNAATAVTRLIEMEIEPYLVASTMVASLAQRLVRKLCDNCKFESESGKWEKKGCEQCNNSGYKGRLGIFELLILDDELRNLIISKADANKIEAAAKKKGMLVMLEDGMAKANKGLTTEKEVKRVASD